MQVQCLTANSCNCTVLKTLGMKLYIKKPVSLVCQDNHKACVTTVLHLLVTSDNENVNLLVFPVMLLPKELPENFLQPFHLVIQKLEQNT